MHYYPRQHVVTYLEEDRDTIVFTLGYLYAEITPGKGMGELKPPPNIPFDSFLGFYTQEEFDLRQNKKNDDE